MAGAGWVRGQQRIAAPLLGVSNIDCTSAGVRTVVKLVRARWRMGSEKLLGESEVNYQVNRRLGEV